MSHSHGGMDGMSGMGGMDMGSTGLFLNDNKKIAHALWYIVAAAAIIRGIRALVDHGRTILAKRKYSLRSDVPSRPSNLLTQIYHTMLAIARESTYPAMQPLKGRIVSYFTPPPLGQSLLILVYWTVILIMLWTNVFLGPSSSLYGYRWEKPAFRAGWISVTQVPLLYALSCKFNVISIVTGISYERLNWLHRWVSRTLFLTVIVHWAYFFHEWTLADFVKYQLEIMPMVKYGFGAWAVIGWMVLTGFGLFRHLCYELWLLQHLAGAGTLLWLLYVHVPSYARYNIWMAVAFVAFDRGVRGIWSIMNNLHLRAPGKGGIGFKGDIAVYAAGYMRLTVKNVDFDWRAGQHVFLSIPGRGMFESHPFTIANTRLTPRPGDFNEEETGSRDLEVFFKCHDGFTKQLQAKAQHRQAAGTSLTVNRIFLSGPWGTPPLSAIERSNCLIFVASSTGASYTMPLLEHAIQKAPFVQSISFYWVVRYATQAQWFDGRLRAAMRQLASLGVRHIQFKLFVTGPHDGADLRKLNIPADTTSEVRTCRLRSQGLPCECKSHGIRSPEETRSTLKMSEDSSSHCDEKNQSEKPVITAASVSSSSSVSTAEHDCGLKGCMNKPTLDSPSFTYALGRPISFDPLIRPAVEAAKGETVIVACGGKAMMASIRTYVAKLSDERAVHKGTGAQGIYLWTESYGW
ncbi:ferric-chelate reductase Frp1 [Exophiala xenobiotica]|uniref:ferric-chelate reductase (NADPH) n=1 Tax=Lithohypha guttulata TaxID=1690604 RepID=A0ABR0JWE3_9EURO|nr:ferric-chelate reductase Frp1 [Lithohypha guttulata]KAK5319344.1 ferric-chelate reductase Frp1 [Exophiala xenobiotica]